ncbi:hypothetical protein JXJ21_18105 [candidate division KSB1 bacterium]|nr:hypothetical protein [candidate division KSB1 bacterium]
MDKKVYCVFCLIFIIFACGSQTSLIYNRQAPQNIKRIAVVKPDSEIIANSFSADFLQKILAYMIFQETSYFIQPLDSTNAVQEVNFAQSSPNEIGSILQVDAILKYDFLDILRSEQKSEGFIFSISLLDCKQGKTVWQTIRRFRGKENLTSYQELRNYFKNKSGGADNFAYFAELYSVMREAFEAFPEPDFTDDERTKRLLDMSEPF